MKKIAVVFVCLLVVLAVAAIVMRKQPMSTEDFIDLCQSGTPKKVEAAIKAGTDVNARYTGCTGGQFKGVTPLMLAARNRNAEFLDILIQAGADVNAEDDDSWTPLTFAASFNKNPEVLSVLIQAGADVNARDSDDWTVLMYAARFNENPEVLNVLIQAGADVNATDNDGWTPLMVAAVSSKNPEILSVLIQAGADVSAKNNKGQTAFYIARAINKPEFASILEAAAGRR